MCYVHCAVCSVPHCPPPPLTQMQPPFTWFHAPEYLCLNVGNILRQIFWVKAVTFPLSRVQTSDLNSLWPRHFINDPTPPPPPQTQTRTHKPHLPKKRHSLTLNAMKCVHPERFTIRSSDTVSQAFIGHQMAKNRNMFAYDRCSKHTESGAAVVRRSWLTWALARPIGSELCYRPIGSQHLGSPQSDPQITPLLLPLLSPDG